MMIDMLLGIALSFVLLGVILYITDPKVSIYLRKDYLMFAIRTYYVFYKYKLKFWLRERYKK